MSLADMLLGKGLTDMQFRLVWVCVIVVVTIAVFGIGCLIYALANFVYQSMVILWNEHKSKGGISDDIQELQHVK